MDDIALLQQIRDANPAAGAQFLEHLILQKRSTVSSFPHTAVEVRTSTRMSSFFFFLRFLPLMHRLESYTLS